jgi:hypothetical protein
MSTTVADHRRSKRAGLQLRGRFMLSDGGEFRCQTIDVSVTGIAIQAHVVANLGERSTAGLQSTLRRRRTG